MKTRTPDPIRLRRYLQGAAISAQAVFITMGIRFERRYQSLFKKCGGRSTFIIIIIIIIKNVKIRVTLS